MKHSLANDIVNSSSNFEQNQTSINDLCYNNKNQNPNKN